MHDIDLNIKIFTMGIENDAILGNFSTMRQKVSVFVYMLAGIFISKHRLRKNNSIGWVNGDRGYEKFFVEDDVTIIFHGTAFKKILNLRRMNSIFSFFKIHERTSLLIKAMRIYIKKRKLISNKALWLEYYFIFEFLVSNKPDYFLTTGIYDRHTTWQSHIMKSIGGNFYIKQHGVNAISEIKHKIYCDKIMAFNLRELKSLKNFVVENASCQYEVVDYISLIDFANSGFKDGIKIGVITQVNYKRVKSWIDLINTMAIPVWFFLMLHPLDKKQNYNNIKKYENVLDAKEEKFIDMDIIIVENSTLIYDYIVNGYTGTILRVDSENVPMEINDDFAGEYIFTDDPENLPSILKDWTQRNYNGLRKRYT